MQPEHYCEHFKNLKLTKNINIPESSVCRYCMLGRPHLWLCLSKNCATFLCDRNDRQHLLHHLQQTRAKKAFHSLYINVLTAKIICVHCEIEIYDLDQLKSISKISQYQNPYPLRLKVLPPLGEFDSPKTKSTPPPTEVIGQLENSQGHRRISKALTGLFGDKYNHAINSAIQFLIQFRYYRSLLLQTKLSQQSKILHELRQIFAKAESAELRAIRSDELTNLLYKENPSLLGYSRKDPFQHVKFFMNLLHEEIKYYSVDEIQEERDEWDVLSKQPSQVTLNCPFFDEISSTLNLNYECKECKTALSSPVNINFIKLNFPRKKRKVKEVEKELAMHRCTSPVKRRNSLINLFMPQPECPFTIPELIIDLLKQPFHKEKTCKNCKKNLKLEKVHFSNLSQHLLIVINRMGKDGNSIDDTKLELDLNELDMGPFTQDSDNVLMYDLQTAICIDKGCLFPVIGANEFNKQFYIFKNEMVSLLKSEKSSVNPYILCYRRRTDEVKEKKIKDIYSNVASNIEVSSEKKNLGSFYLLPDFWVLKLKASIIKPLKNQLVCRHGYRKPEVESKMITPQLIPSEVYEFLLEEYTGDWYKNEPCEVCSVEVEKLNERRRREKQLIIQYDKMKTQCFCMVSHQWIKKWMSFLYKKGESGYLSKGNPLPGSIENKILLDGGKCRKDLHRNVDYRVVNIYLWRFLKDLYGGGPEIRYKWNQSEMKKGDEEKLQEIRQIAKGVKEIFTINYIESPKKSVIIERTTSFVQSAHESQLGEDSPEVREG